MRARWLLIVLIAYVAVDLADPVVPGAFSFEVDASPVEQAVHANRPRPDKTASAVPPALPECRIEPRADSLPLQRRAVLVQPLTKGASLRPTPRSALLVPAPSPEDH